MPRPPLRPSPRTIAIENTAFLRALRRSGNAKAAAGAIGRHEGTMYRRRANQPDFAVEWRAAVVVAAARLESGRRKQLPETWEEAPPSAYRASGGEPVIVRGRGGRLQQRAARPGRLTRACEQAFLLALSCTANVTLSAAAAGSTPTVFYRRRRVDPGFAREWREALAEGYARLELRCMAAADPESHAHDAWRHHEAPEPPPMSVNQMLQLLYLHQKEARLLAEPAHVKRRRGESREAHAFRMAAMHEERLRRAREQFRVAEAVRAARGQETHFDWERIVLPDLAQVKAGRGDPAKTPHEAGHHQDRALFGGWRIDDMAAARTRAEQAGKAKRGKTRG